MKKELLFSVTKKDLEIETFTAGGKGGQNQNKVATGVRIRHPESGAVSECRETRSQLENKERAFKKLINSPRFKIWYHQKVYSLLSKKSVEEVVSESMRPENIKTEIKENGRWTETDVL